MKKVLLGVAIGSVLGYFFRKLQNDGAFDDVYDCVSDKALKAKRNLKNIVDTGRNQAEYLTDRASDIIDRGKEKLSKAVADEK